MHMFHPLNLIVLLTVFNGDSVELKTVKIPQSQQVSELGKEKQTAWFRNIDVNNDGVVTKEECVDEVAKRAQRVLSSWRAKALYGLMSKASRAWLYMDPSGLEQPINLNRWIELFEMDLLNVTLNGLELDFCLDWFHILDEDCDEEMSVQEYSKFLVIFRNTLPPGELFNVADLNKDAIISSEEFLHGCESFYYEMEDNSTAFFYGSLAI